MKFGTLVIERVAKTDWDLKGLQKLEKNYMQSTFAVRVGIVKNYYFSFSQLLSDPVRDNLLCLVYLKFDVQGGCTNLCCVSERGIILNESWYVRG